MDCFPVPCEQLVETVSGWLYVPTGNLFEQVQRSPLPCVRRTRPRSPLDLCVHRAERLAAGAFLWRELAVQATAAKRLDSDRAGNLAMAMTNSESQWLARALRLINQVIEPSKIVDDSPKKDPAEHALHATQYLIRILSEIEANFEHTD